MRSIKTYTATAVTLFIVLVSWKYAAIAATIDQLVAAAKKEALINFHAPSALSPQGVQALSEAFNKKYGINIKINYFPSSSFTRDTSKVISQSALGVSPDWDLMTLTDVNHSELSQKKLHLSFDYKSLGIDPRAVQHDNGTVAITHGIVLPAFNTKVVVANDAPRSWEDLLDPRWSDGKLGISDATYYFTLFASGPWGEEKTRQYVRGLAKQKPVLGRLAELATRLQLGEIFVAAMLAESTVHVAKSKGAPVAFAEAVEPVLVTTTSIGVLKGAAHPNAALLFTAFNVSPEAQEIWEKYRGTTSAFVAGTKTSKFLKGKQTIYQGTQETALVERLSNEYSKILGFSR
jgi:iron(III) transport system substrate-binding protein